MVRPFRYVRRLRNQLPNPLVAMRMALVNLAAAPPLVFLAIALLDLEEDPKSWFLWSVLLAAVVSLAAILRLRARPLRPGSESSVVAQYRALTHIGMAQAVIPSLLGLALLFVGAWGWLPVLGYGFAAAGLVLIAPTARDIARRQGELVRAGSSISLMAVLTRSPAV